MARSEQPVDSLCPVFGLCDGEATLHMKLENYLNRIGRLAVWPILQEALLFNAHSGFLEGIIRVRALPSTITEHSSYCQLQGYKSGLLTTGHYQNLTQCESLDGACLSAFYQPLC